MFVCVYKEIHIIIYTLYICRVYPGRTCPFSRALFLSPDRELCRGVCSVHGAHEWRWVPQIILGTSAPNPWMWELPDPWVRVSQTPGCESPKSPWLWVPKTSRHEWPPNALDIGAPNPLKQWVTVPNPWTWVPWTPGHGCPKPLDVSAPNPLARSA